MKKIILIGLICLLIVGIAIATYSSREEARTAILNYIQTRDSVIDQVILTIIYIEEPECEIKEFQENIYDVCTIYFKFDYTINGEEKTINDSIFVSGDLTDEEIDKQINKYVKEKIEENYPKEEFKYSRTGFLGRKIQIISK